METAVHPLIAYAAARGGQPHDLRDAAHEAFHALSVGAKRDWDREAIHRRLVRRFKGAELWAQEIYARAVETLVCCHFGEPYEADKWIAMSAMEAIKFRLPYADPDVSEPIYLKALRSDRVKRWADDVIALGAKP